MDRLAAMEVFARVVDAGSFPPQRDDCQPALTKSIAQLESRLGVKLLARTTRGLAPTKAGQNFYDRARRAIQEAEEAELLARGASAG